MRVAQVGRLMPSELATILLLAPIAFLGAFVYGVTGFGAGLFTIPLASHFYEMPFVLAVFAVLDSVNAIRVCVAQPQAIVREEAVRLVPVLYRWRPPRGGASPCRTGLGPDAGPGLLCVAVCPLQPRYLGRSADDHHALGLPCRRVRRYHLGHVWGGRATVCHLSEHASPRQGADTRDAGGDQPGEHWHPHCGVWLGGSAVLMDGVEHRVGRGSGRSSSRCGGRIGCMQVCRARR